MAVWVASATVSLVALGAACSSGDSTAAASAAGGAPGASSTASTGGPEPSSSPADVSCISSARASSSSSVGGPGGARGEAGASSSGGASGGGDLGGSGGSGGALPTCDACVTVASLPHGSKPYGIFVDDQNVYWTNSGTGEVMQAKTDGTNVVTLTTGEDSPITVQVFQGNVYWASYSVIGVIRMTPIGGGPVVNLSTAPAAREILIGSQFIWWTREPDDVQRMPVTGEPDAMPPDLLTGNLLSEGLAGDDASVYWVNRGDGFVKRADLDLSNETPLAAGDIPFDVAVDDATIYWTEVGSSPSTGRVVRASKVDGANALPLATGQASPMGIAIDAAGVYWANNADGTIHAAPIDGSTDEVTLAVGQAAPINVAVDASFVYWANTEGDAIVKVAK
ncbi:MAG TPA: hypothetical protein VGM56_07435 [Byssovorax sp.]